MADVLVRNAKGRFVVLSEAACVEYFNHHKVDEATKLPRIVDEKDSDFSRGMELSQDSKKDGVRGDKELQNTGDGLVTK